MARAVQKPARSAGATPSASKRKTASRAKPKAKPAVKVKAKAKAKAKPKVKAKPQTKAKAKPTAAAKRAPAKTTRAKPAVRRKTTQARTSAKPPNQPIAVTAGSLSEATLRASNERVVDAVPAAILAESSGDAHRRLFTARDRAIRSSPVVEILDDPHPISALRRFLDSLKGDATTQQAQIALGSAQLMLMPYVQKEGNEREHRGGPEVRELVDMVMRHWADFGDRGAGFHAQEFLKHAFIALGVDRARVARLEQLIPRQASSDLLFNLACAYAASRDKVAMLRVIEQALAAGASPAEFRRDPDFAVYANDPDVAVLLARAEVPQIPVDVEPYLPAVRAALDSLLSTLQEFGESVELRPPVRLDAILDSERAGKVSLPNDYRALLTITNGMRLWEHEFFGAGDYREHTRLAARSQQFLSSSFGVTGIAECVPVASWGQPRDWLVYDPRGRLRAGEPGYVLMLDTDAVAVEDLAAALAHMENLAREVLGTN